MSHGSTVIKRVGLAALVAAVGVGLVQPAMAGAGTVGYFEATAVVAVLAPDSESHQVSIFDVGFLGTGVEAHTFAEGGRSQFTPVAGSRCRSISERFISCPQLRNYYVRVGPGPDVVRVDSPYGGRIFSSGGVDNVFGGSGPDLIGLSSGAHPDYVRGGGGNDLIYADNGAADKLIDCGAGDDRARLDAIDPAPVGCEQVTR